MPLEPARASFAPDGTARSEIFGDVYHADEGGPGQARHVFLSGNDLPRRWQDRERFVILENGFGGGLNFLATWHAWRADPLRPRRLHYLAVEKHPFAAADLARLHAAWQEFHVLGDGLRAAWPVLTPGFHRLEFAAGRVVLTLMLGDAAACLRRLRASVDAFYLDGFDPRKNPDMWSPDLFRRCAQLAAADATLATWCVAGAVRAALGESGFATEKRPGFGRKREMLTGRLARPALRAAAAAPPSERHAVVVGAGLAGCALGERLATRGWRVEVLDSHAAPAREASGNLAGIVRPLLSRDDNLASRLNRACFLHAARAWSYLDRTGQPPRRCLDGVLQIARDAGHEARQRELAAIYPADYVRFLDRQAAGKLLGHPTAFGAWFFPGGGWASPPSLCRAQLAAGGLGVKFRGETEVARMRRSDGLWRLYAPTGAVLAESPHVILAAGARASALAPATGLPIRPVRGQVSHIAAGRLPSLRHAACREGYLTPALDGMHCLGASYAYDDGAELRAEEHAGNLRRLALILPGGEQGLEVSELSGRVGFRAATPDRLPLVGALPDPGALLDADCRLAELPRLPGLFGMLGLGSRGLVWAALAAETLASLLDGDPPPLEGDLLDALDPGRFRLRVHRRGR
ncbi:bifunctional tRNA (5-methylaminomethyl-2-thiouridine)(34)-methyltransferase MnmD/FAD-dependent 5-carboxymethylaminomethyl-2-thiouridine(34) oxidoreductase MnmC [bacterium]|nr:bifunctional tRNA (5-methylaminomethyl-2-thiouridine)(34)-methyltransferase MnmD/FAD-dependent 5-carboxymethylaminomethyl-2-thiouridine(34) oxidoreductase MnmC [bacterium]